MRYSPDHYIDPILGQLRSLLYWMISAPAGFAIILTAVFFDKMLQVFGISETITQTLLFPAIAYFLWAVLIGGIDMIIERDEL